MVTFPAFNRQTDRHQGEKRQDSEGGGIGLLLGFWMAGQSQRDALGWQVSHNSRAVGSGSFLGVGSGISFH